MPVVLVTINLDLYRLVTELDRRSRIQPENSMRIAFGCPVVYSCDALKVVQLGTVAALAK